MGKKTKKVKTKKGVKKNWIGKAVKRPGRVKEYLKRKYGDKAFTRSGEVKQQYVDRAIRDMKNKGTKNKSLLRALYLARTLERMKKDKKK